MKLNFPYIRPHAFVQAIDLPLIEPTTFTTRADIEDNNTESLRVPLQSQIASWTLHVLLPSPGLDLLFLFLKPSTSSTNLLIGCINPV
jgi:hypothetical protein